MEENKFLTKEEELRLGSIVQNHYKAKNKLENSDSLSEEEIEALRMEISEGEDAIDILVRANIGLVRESVKKFKSKFPAGLESEDLVQEGMTGLMTAIQKYDPNWENKLSTVAFYWISQAVTRGSNKTARLVRLPENRINDYTKINKFMRSDEIKDLSQREIEDLIVSKFKISRRDLMNIQSAAASPASLNKVVFSESQNKELIDFLDTSFTANSTEDIVVEQGMRDILEKSLSDLTPIKRDVVISSYNFDESLTVADVKEKYGLKTNSFKKILSESMKDMKNSITSHGVTFEDFANSSLNES